MAFEDPQHAIECIQQRTDILFAETRRESPLVNHAPLEEDELYVKSKVIALGAKAEYDDTKQLEKAEDEAPVSILYTRIKEREERYSDNPSLLASSETLMPELLQYFPQRVELAQYAQPNASRTLIRHQQATSITSKPEWHAPWKLMKVITGHQGWVRSIAIEPENKWFATGASDATIKIWDLASSRLKVTLAGHIMPVRGLVVSERHPYLFSASEDKTVKNWDLEKNKIVRDYYGHVSSVYALDLHPHLDVLASAGRDAVVRVWDVRSRTAIHVISGHTSSITNVKFQDADPQLVSTSMDGTIRLYDLVAGKTRQVLTHHKKAVRGLAIHPEEFTMATASSDDIKQWGFPEGDLLGSCYPNHTGIVNTIALNDSNVLFSGADDGSMAFFDWKTGHKFQDTATTAIPGSLESERGIFASSFDKSGLRLLTGETDKSVKVWREDPDATPETHPGNSWDYSMAVGEI